MAHAGPQTIVETEPPLPKGQAWIKIGNNKVKAFFEGGEWRAPCNWLGRHGDFLQLAAKLKALNDGTPAGSLDNVLPDNAKDPKTGAPVGRG